MKLEIIEKKIGYLSENIKLRENSQIFSEIILVSRIIISKMCTSRNIFLITK